MAGKTKDSSKKERGIKNFFGRISRFFLDVRGEMKRVVWPTKKQTMKNTGVVIAFILVMSVFIGLFDFGLAALIKLFFGA